MAENWTLDNGAIDDLYLRNGIMAGGLIFLVFSIIGHLNMILPLLIIMFLYICYKWAIHMHIEECWYCTDPTPTGAVCEKSKTKKVRFCRIIERWTVWLLVDLFRTPNVAKVKENNKVHLKLLEKRSLVLGEKVLKSALLFVCISYIFTLYIEKFLVDVFLKFTPTCINTGDFGIPAACYALNTSYFDNSSTFEILYQINCTTWNDNLESLGEEIGLLFCFSFYYNILTSVTEMIGLFGLQTVVVQLTLILAKKCTHLVDKYTQEVTEEDKRNKQCCRATLIYIIAGVGYAFICFAIPMLIIATDRMNTKQIYEVSFQQVLPTQIAYLSMILAMLLMLLMDKNGKTTEETCNTRQCDEELLTLFKNLNTNPHGRLKGITSILSMTHGHQRNCFTEERMEEQIDGETNIFVIEGGRNTWYDSEDERSSETTQRQDITSVEIHDYTPEEACTTGEHNGGGYRMNMETNRWNR